MHCSINYRQRSRNLAQRCCSKKPKLLFNSVQFGENELKSITGRQGGGGENEIISHLSIPSSLCFFKKDFDGLAGVEPLVT